MHNALLNLAGLVVASLLLAIGLAMAIGPVRLLAKLAAGLIVIPVLWAAFAFTAVAIWIALRLHSG
jgi:hypothetical protein